MKTNNQMFNFKLNYPSPPMSIGVQPLDRGNNYAKNSPYLGSTPILQQRIGGRVVKTAFFLIIFNFLFFVPSKAENFSSSNFQIIMGNLNLTGGGKTSPSFNLTDTVGQNAPGQYDGSSTIVKGGFQYIYDTLQYFTFQINSLTIPFGTLVPGTPSTASNTLTITTPYGKGYEIYAKENHALKIIGSGITIPDTKCDAGTCSESTSGTWSSNSIYGFGLNASGDGATAYFSSGSQYRQFADASLGESPQIISSENVSVKNKVTTVNYKLNVSTVQSAGNYENAITYIAVPKY